MGDLTTNTVSINPYQNYNYHDMSLGSGGFSIGTTAPTTKLKIADNKIP